MKKIISLVMVVVSLFLIMSVSASAENTNENTIIVNETEFIFDDNVSEDFRNKFIADYFNEDEEDAVTYGLTCTLFGHKLESSIITVITHKERATDPRCLRETFDTEACTRCDYTNQELISDVYISCCK